METKAVRAFYRKADNEIVWTHELKGTGEFPLLIEDNLSEIPNKMPDGEMPLGGVPEDYACIEETDPQRASDFLASDDNKVVDGKLVIGAPRPEIPPEPPHSTHISIIEAIDPTKARPVRIKRTWEGKDYFYDCFASQSVKDQYVAGDVKVGDYVVAFWSDIGEQIVTAKVYKSW